MVMVLARSDIGDRVRNLRTSLGMTQGQVAEYAGVDRSWLSLLERGGIEDPSGGRLARVARVLGMPVDYLLSGTTDAGLVPLMVEPSKAAILGRLSRLPDDQLARFERAMADIFGLWDVDPATGEPDRETHDQPEGD